MQSFVHSVLGTNYEVLFGSYEELKISNRYAGLCKIYSKKILVCTDKGECTEDELRVKVQEVVAHELFHAYLNEAGVEVSDGDEEKVCYFYMKNWRKLNNSILEILDESGFLDK